MGYSLLAFIEGAVHFVWVRTALTVRVQLGAD